MLGRLGRRGHPRGHGLPRRLSPSRRRRCSGRRRGTYTSLRSGTIIQRWRRVAGFARRAPEQSPPPGQPPREGPAPPGRRPAIGDYVYVEELPEIITKVPPIYPDEAKRAGVEGTVMVQALVLEDGTVADCGVTQSVPALDDAANASVRQWIFKPALANNKPVAVWVAVRVRFGLQ
ncbi:MAG: hypothetical protein A2W00_10370 [Candidatus Eisenbacteria bacterium RBG_16_71_46]|nr:MAG: hypothetical protein A2W00_10370 [Candidatus Eisenbacteria bacterium RBG_16_71_46]